MKGVSDSNAPKKIKQMGQNKDLKRPPQVLQINKRDSKEDVRDKNNNDLYLSNNEALQEVIKPETTLKNKVLTENLTSEKVKEVVNNLKQNQILNKLEKPENILKKEEISFQERKVDDFDFDETEFLAALNENEPIGLTGENIKGKVIAIESDGLYVDIGGKAPGFMPKKECGLGVITNFKEKFPIGLEVEVLVIKEQNADGMVTVSSRALILRKSWETVSNISKSGELINVLINGFNRGGLTCDVEGLRGFIPRSQLEDGSDYQSLINKTIRVAFLEVNPDTKKLVLSEKKASLITKFLNLTLGQLIEGEVLAIKPYGFFIDLGGASGLLHQSAVTNGSIRNLREVFSEGENIKALITEIDLEKGRIGLDTALLENSPGELLIDKATVMNEATERAHKAQSLFIKETS